MKTVVLSGYYGFNNARDEALLAALQDPSELDSDLNLVVLSAAPKQTEKQHGIKAVSRSIRGLGAHYVAGGSINQRRRQPAAGCNQLAQHPLLFGGSDLGTPYGNPGHVLRAGNRPDPAWLDALADPGDCQPG